jgi:4-hydroxy-tetrahydrodipicolinate reductase
MIRNRPIRQYSDRAIAFLFAIRRLCFNTALRTSIYKLQFTNYKSSMNLLLLGPGKTGSLVREVSGERGHSVAVLDQPDNVDGAGLNESSLAGIDVVIDFTTPQAVLRNIERCAQMKKNIVVGTTGWYGEIPRIRQLVESSGIGLLYAANFSVGVNLFFDIVRSAAPALRYGYTGAIEERHHIHKKDAPSGTAVAIQQVIKASSGVEVPISSVREGELMGRHTLTLTSSADSITLTHDASSRRGFAEGAVRAAEWLRGRHGFYDFRDVWREMA